MQIDRNYNYFMQTDTNQKQVLSHLTVPPTAKLVTKALYFTRDVGTRTSHYQAVATNYEEAPGEPVQSVRTYQAVANRLYE